MVSRESATRSLCHSQPSSTIQIDQNHSDMVKFVVGDHSIGILASKLESICSVSETATPTLPSNARKDSSQTHERSNHQPEWTVPGFWNDDMILSSLRAPERDRRLEQIQQQLGDTFNWAYDDTSVGLSEWLQNGTGIFWINGKPASGKSTLMKYLYQDPRTEELLGAGSWQSGARLMKASFFFHHRGTNTQKSFEGLLRSLVSQLLEQEKTLFFLLYPILVDQYQMEIVVSNLGNFEKDIWDLLNHFEIPHSPRVIGQVEKIVSSQIALTESRQLGIHLKRMLMDLGVKPWLEPGEADYEVNLDVPEDIRKTEIHWIPNQEQHDESKPVVEPRNWAEVLTGTLQRHYKREEIKIGIQARKWSRQNLEDCLRRLIGQSLFKMDLFFFLDALDEYDGKPEFIASFLQDLVQQPLDPSTQSSSRIKILFSSRPWKAFNDKFAACLGFQIHDYTWNDIIELCAASIPPDDIAKTFLSPLVIEVVRRARGVFLWVVLVMRDLTKTVRESVHLRDAQGLKQELRHTLDELPDELDDYYQFIVKRISPDTHWESYVILETLCRSNQDIDMETLLTVLQCWSAKSLTDAQNKLTPTSRMPLQAAGLARAEKAERYIKVVSGGLVEVNDLSVEGNAIVQFMHQTVKQFVMDPRFKFHLLGNMGMFITENGHCFISKYLFINSRFEDSFFYHAKEAETTTGFSQYDFFSTAPPDHLISRYSHRIQSLIAMAVVAGLELCLRDAYESDRCCVERNSEQLVYLLVDAVEGKETEDQTDSILNMATMLVAMGLSIDDSNLSWVAEHLCHKYGRSEPALEEPGCHSRGCRSTPTPVYRSAIFRTRAGSQTELCD